MDTPLTTVFLDGKYVAYDSLWIEFAQHLERRAAAWARSARNNREDSTRWMRCAHEQERVNQEQIERILQLIVERDTALAGVARAHDERSEERIQLEANLARVTAERDELENDLRDANTGADKRVRRMLEAEEKVRVQFHELAALRARNAELEKIISDSLKAAPVGNVTKHTVENLPAIVSDLAQSVGDECSDADQLRKRNAELEAALRNYKRLKGCHGEYRAWSDLSDALARAESATLDHIVDADKMVEPATKHVPEICFGNIPQATPAPHPDSVEVRNRIGGINVEEAGNRGDNLAIVLASYFSEHEERPDDDRDDPETGWSVWAMQKTNTALTLIAVAAVGGAK